jgi:hypothetical protein
VLLKIDETLLVFIDEVNDEYYADYLLASEEVVHPLSDDDIEELPNFAGINQGTIKVWNL